MESVPHIGHVIRATVALYWFGRRRFELTESQFELYFDTLTAMLEWVNNEKHRLTPKG